MPFEAAEPIDSGVVMSGKLASETGIEVSKVANSVEGLTVVVRPG